MRRLFVALVAAAIILPVTGCGGGGGEAEEGAVVPAADVAASAPATATAVTEILDRSAPEPAVVFEPFPISSAVPTAVADRVEAHQATLILFVDGSQKVTNEVRSAVDKALKENNGVVDLVLFDLGRYVSVDASGVAVVDAEGLQADATASQAVTLARELEVIGLPYIIMVDDQAHIVFRHRGLVDEEYLLMHMERLTE